MRHPDYGCSVGAGGVHEDAHDVAAGTLVERAGRLIGENDGRLHGECAGDGDALHLAAAHLTGTLGRKLTQSQSFQPQHGRIGGLLVACTAQHHRQGDVFDGRQFR